MRALMMLAGLLFVAPAMAGEADIVLKDGQGKDLVEANCRTCHSLDYIEMNSPFLDQKKWEATVAKMIDRFGAPVPTADVPAIVSYLTANYGPQPPKP